MQRIAYSRVLYARALRLEMFRLEGPVSEDQGATRSDVFCLAQCVHTARETSYDYVYKAKKRKPLALCGLRNKWEIVRKSAGSRTRSTRWMVTKVILPLSLDSADWLPEAFFQLVNQCDHTVSNAEFTNCHDVTVRSLL